MARIRSVKPELRTSLKVAEWPREVRYFWVLLWGYLDDHGYGVDNALLIKADCLPLDADVDDGTVDKWLTLMAGPVCRYAVAGRRFVHAPSWPEHQRPQHPKGTKIPPCPHHDLGEPRSDFSAPPAANGSDLHEASSDLHDVVMTNTEVLIPEQGAGSREVEVEQGGGAAAPAPRGRRIPDDFTVTPDMVAWARGRCPAVDGRTETEKFINHWRGKSGKDATKVDWEATWRNWMLSALDRYGPSRASPNGSTTDDRVSAALALKGRFTDERAIS